MLVFRYLSYFAWLRSVVEKEQNQKKRTRQHYHRTFIYPEQKSVLQNYYSNVKKFPNLKDRIELEQLTGLPQKVIATWFRNYKRRNEEKE